MGCTESNFQAGGEGVEAEYIYTNSWSLSAPDTPGTPDSQGLWILQVLQVRGGGLPVSRIVPPPPRMAPTQEVKS